MYAGLLEPWRPPEDRWAEREDELMYLETTQTTAATAAAMITSRLFWVCSATEAWSSPLSLPEPLEQALPVSEAVWSMEGSVSVRRAAKQKNAKKAGGFLVFAQKRGNFFFPMVLYSPQIAMRPVFSLGTARCSSPMVLTAPPTDFLASAAADPIATAFFLGTFAPQPLWGLLTLLPNASFTRRVMEPLLPIVVLSLVHLFVVTFSAGLSQAEGTAPIDVFNNVFNPTADGLAAYLELSTYRNFVTEEWSHVLIWDLFVGRYIWMDGLRRGVFTSHSVLLTNLIGPPGLLLHLLTLQAYRIAGRLRDEDDAE